jgi:hypothetical protein
MHQPSGSSESSRCGSCGRDTLRNYRRLNHRVGGTLRIRLVIALALSAAVAAILEMFTIFAILIAASLTMLAAAVWLPRLLGVRWWGGTRCAACGHVVMLR